MGADAGLAPAAKSSSRAATISESHCAEVVACALSGAAHFATASLDCALRLWSLEDFSVPIKVRVRDAGLPTGGLHAGENAMFSGWSDGRIRAHLTGVDPAASAGIMPGAGSALEARDAPMLWAIDEAHEGGVGDVRLSHNGRFLLSGGAAG